jgi:hypothetical protein
MARWVDYYLGRQGGPRVHPTGQPGAMAPQRRGAVAAPSQGPTRQATCHAARLAFDRTAPPSEALGRIRDAFRAYDEGEAWPANPACDQRVRHR